MTYKPRYANLVQLLVSAVERFPQRPLFGTRQNQGWHYDTYAQFDALVAAARGGLASLGLKPGERVAVISDNRLEWAVCEFASFSYGTVFVPMYQAQLDKEYRYILHDSGAKLCLCANPEISARVRAILPELPELKHIISFGSPEYEALLEQGRATPVPLALPADADIATIIYTSGTTGNPKGVELTHYNLGSAASGIVEIAPLNPEGEQSLSFLPWAHVFGGCIELSTMIGYGAAIAICDNTDKLLDYLGEVKPTALFAVPRIWNRVYEGVNKQIAARPKALQSILRTGLRARARHAKGQPITLGERLALLVTNKFLISKIQARLGGRLRFAVSGAAALSQEVAEFIDSLGIVVLEGYGMTETAGGATGSQPHLRRLGSVGKPLKGWDIELDANVAGAQPGEGELIIHGPGVMRGYHNIADTQGTFTANGGLRTGDIGRYDDEGFLYITGRVKELYKLSNGKYVAPVALEEKLQLSPYIAQVCVNGSDRPHNTAVVIVNMPTITEWAAEHGLSQTSPAALLQAPELRALIRAEIDTHSRGAKGFELVRDFVLDDEPFSTQNDLLTPTLKLKRRNVLAKYAKRLDTLYKQAPASARAEA